MYKVETSEFEIEYAFLRLVSLFIASITDLFIALFDPESINASKKHLLIIICLHLSEEKLMLKI